VIAQVLNNDPRSVFIVAVQEIEEVRFKIGETTFKSNAEGTEFDGGQLGGIPIVANIVQRLNTLENRMTSHQHLSAAPGVQTAVDPVTNPTIQQTEVGDLENEKLKQ